MLTYAEIRKCLEQAALKKEKMAMFHYVFLTHAEEFMDENPKEICLQIGVRKSMASEISKMRALYLFMKKNSAASALLRSKI